MEPSPDVDAAVVQATKALDAVDDARAQAWAAVQAAATAAGCAPGDLFGHKVNIDALQKGRPPPRYRCSSRRRRPGSGIWKEVIPGEDGTERKGDAARHRTSYRLSTTAWGLPPSPT